MQFQFNSQQYAPQFGGGGGLSTGRHKVIITDTGPEPVNGKPDHMMLKLTIRAVEGPDNGKSMDLRFMMIWPSDPGVADGGNKRLSAVCHVTGKYAFQDTQELHNIPFYVDVEPQKKNPQYQEVVKLYDLNGKSPGDPAGQPAAAAPAMPPAQAQPAVGFGAGAGPAEAAPGAWPAAAAEPAPAAGFGGPAVQPAAGFGAAPAAAPSGFGAPAGGAPAWGAR